MFSSALRYSLFFFTLLPCFVSAAVDQQVVHFSQALEAARQNQWATLDQQQKLLGDNFILQDYLDYHRLRASLKSAPLEQVQGYLRQHQDSPLADSMRRMAMEHYGQQGQWRQLQAVSSGVPGPLTLRCYYYQAMLDGERENALKKARKLWLSGQSRPSACEPLFDALKQAGQLDDQLIWQRLLLAAEANNNTLLRHLRSELSEPLWQARADTLLKMLRQPEQVRYLEAAEQHAAISVLALKRLAEQQPQEALRQLPMLARRFSFNDQQKKQVSDQIAWFSTIRDLPENRAWLNSYLADHNELRVLEQRARRAIIEQDWPGVAYWIERLPSATQNNARWHYWMARSYAARDNQDKAQQYYQLAANARSFWGFLAADQIGRAAALSEEAAPAKKVVLGEHSEQVLRRVSLLLAVNEAGHARNEWLLLLRHLDDADQQDALAQIALERGWPHLAIETALHTGRHDVLDWRFPLAQQEHFAHAAKKHDIDSWLLMAVARRESAFNPQARSHAGAMGLMQLMPGTAKDMARQNGSKLSNNNDVFEPALNIDLGSGYLAGLLKRYNNNRVLALAAYNAGPHRVDQWLDGEEVPFDVFIESIPFYETREYVQAVLAYRVILSRHNANEPLLALLDNRETTRPYSPTLLAANQEKR